MKDKYTAQGPTTEEAINNGLEALGISRDDAVITINQESKKGFLGIGQRDAVVVVTRKNKKSMVEELVSTAIQLDDQPTPIEKSVKKAPVSDKSAPKPAKVEKELKTEPKKDPVRPKVKTNEVNEKDEKAIQSVAGYIERITHKMGVDDVSVSVSKEGRRILYAIETENAGLIIGRHGKVLNSLQTLAQIQLHQEADNKLFARVDAENYRNRRQKTVEQLAKRTADKVKRTNRPVILEPMPAHERKQIHRYLNRYGGVQTHSEGKEPHRYLVVEPAEKEEFTL